MRPRIHTVSNDTLGGYEWVPDKIKISVGPNTVSLDASGWVAGISIGKNF